MENEEFSEKKVRATRTSKTVIEARFAIFVELAARGMTFEEIVEVTNFPENQVMGFEARWMRKEKKFLPESMDVFGLEKLSFKLKSDILPRVPSGGLWKVEWAADNQSVRITRHTPHVSDELEERIKAVRPAKRTDESN